MTDKLIIFDTTLRDGEQSPGASMTREEKLRIARQLERLRVDVIEAGFAASSNGDFDAVKAIASTIKDSTVCSLARANDRDIARAAEALRVGIGDRGEMLEANERRAASVGADALTIAALPRAPERGSSGAILMPVAAARLSLILMVSRGLSPETEPKAMTAFRPVAMRAILIAFSQASAPVVTKIVFFLKLPGTFSFSRSARRM